jgi:hypothetical protein
MRHALIASCGHPNNQGARSYADNAIRRLIDHRDITQKVRAEERPGARPAAPAPEETLDGKLRRYNLRGHSTLHADVGHLDVDSLAVRVVNGVRSDQNFFPDVWLVVNTKNAAGKEEQRQYLLNFVYRTINMPPQFGAAVVRKWVVKPYPHFEPGATNRLTVDTMGTLRLDEITGCSILIGGDRLKGLQALQEYGKVWRPDVVRLEVNGQQVAQVDTAGQEFGFFSSLDLSYPAPQPDFRPPKLPTVTVRAVRQLGPRVHARRALAPDTI